MLGFLYRSFREKADDSTFWGHIDVLRKYLFRALISVIVFTVGAFFFKEFLFDKVILAPSEPSFITYQVLCKLSVMLHMPDLCVTKIPLQLINTEIGGQFRYHIVISFAVGLILAFPFIIYQFWKFIEPALTDYEKKQSRGIVFYITSLFTIGVLFGYYVIAPLTINFLASYELSALIKNYITISSYISTVSVLSFSMGVVFELPLLILFLTKIGVITPKMLRKYRKYAYIIILIVAGFITPSTDMFTQTIVSIPLWLLYELSLILSLRTKKREVS